MTITERKLVVLGDSGVGKTSLVRRFVTGEFSESYSLTAGTQPYKKAVTVDARQVNVVIWDVAGHILNIHPSYLSDTHGALLVCDLSRQVSAEIMLKWLALARDRVGEVPMLVAGNKSDIASRDTCQALHDAGFRGYRTSARTGENVDTVFMELIRAVL